MAKNNDFSPKSNGGVCDNAVREDGFLLRDLARFADGGWPADGKRVSEAAIEEWHTRDFSPIGR